MDWCISWEKLFVRSEDVPEGWRKLNHEKLHNSYSSLNIIPMIKPRRVRWAGHVARMGVKRNAYRVLVQTPEEWRPFGRHKSKWEDTIKMDLKVKGGDCR
jgi:hypothetical protein